jgi:hypothetical protein
MMDEIINSLVATIRHPLEQRVLNETKPEIPRPELQPTLPPLEEVNKPKDILPPLDNITEVRTVRIGGFSFKVGRKKNISRTTGKRKDPKKVRQGNGELFYSVHVSLIMTENI